MSKLWTLILGSVLFTSVGLNLVLLYNSPDIDRSVIDIAQSSYVLGCLEGGGELTYCKLNSLLFRESINL